MENHSNGVPSLSPFRGSPRVSLPPLSLCSSLFSNLPARTPGPFSPSLLGYCEGISMSRVSCNGYPNPANLHKGCSSGADSKTEMVQSGLCGSCSDLEDSEEEEKSSDPVVFKAGFSFRISDANPKVFNHMKVDPASDVSRTSSDSLSKEISQFLHRQGPINSPSRSHIAPLAPKDFVPSTKSQKITDISTQSLYSKFILRHNESDAGCDLFYSYYTPTDSGIETTSGLTSSNDGSICSLETDSISSSNGLKLRDHSSSSSKGTNGSQTSLDKVITNGFTNPPGTARSPSSASLYARPMGNSQDSIHSELSSGSHGLKPSKKYPAPLPPIARSQSTSVVAEQSRKNSSLSFTQKGIENVYLAPYSPSTPNGQGKNTKKVSRTPSIKKYPAPKPPGLPKTNEGDSPTNRLASRGLPSSLANSSDSLASLDHYIIGSSSHSSTNGEPNQDKPKFNGPSKSFLGSFEGKPKSDKMGRASRENSVEKSKNNYTSLPRQLSRKNSEKSLRDSWSPLPTRKSFNTSTEDIRRNSSASKIQPQSSPKNSLSKKNSETSESTQSNKIYKVGIQNEIKKNKSCLSNNNSKTTVSTPKIGCKSTKDIKEKHQLDIENKESKKDKIMTVSTDSSKNNSIIIDDNITQISQIEQSKSCKGEVLPSPVNKSSNIVESKPVASLTNGDVYNNNNTKKDNFSSNSFDSQGLKENSIPIKNSTQPNDVKSKTNPMNELVDTTQNSLQENTQTLSTDNSLSNSSKQSQKLYKRSKSGKLASLTNKFEVEEPCPKPTLKPQGIKVGLFSGNKLSDLTSKFEKDSPHNTETKTISSTKTIVVDSKRRNSLGGIGGINVSKFGSLAKPNEFLQAKKQKNVSSSSNSPSSSLASSTNTLIESKEEDEDSQVASGDDPSSLTLSNIHTDELLLVESQDSSGLIEVQKESINPPMSNSCTSLVTNILSLDSEVSAPVQLTHPKEGLEKGSQSVGANKNAKKEEDKIQNTSNNSTNSSVWSSNIKEKLPLNLSSSSSKDNESKQHPNVTKEKGDLAANSESNFIQAFPQKEHTISVEASTSIKNITSTVTSATKDGAIGASETPKQASLPQINATRNEDELTANSSIIGTNIPNESSNVSDPTQSHPPLAQISVAGEKGQMIENEPVSVSKTEPLPKQECNQPTTVQICVEPQLLQAQSEQTVELRIQEKCLKEPATQKNQNIEAPVKSESPTDGILDDCDNLVRFEEEYIKQLEKALLEKGQAKAAERNVSSILPPPFTNPVLSQSTDSSTTQSLAFSSNGLLSPHPRKFLLKRSMSEESEDMTCDLLRTRLSPHSAEVIRFHSSKHNELMDKIRGKRRKSRDSQTPENFLTASEILKDAEDRLARAIRSPLPPSSRTSLERESSLGLENDTTQLDILMPLPNSEDLGLLNQTSRSVSPESRERSLTPCSRRYLEQTESLLSETDILLRKSRSHGSLRKSFTRSLSGMCINRLAESTAELSEQHGTAQLAGERLEAEQAERMKLEKEVAQLQNDVKKMTSTNDKLEMERLALRNEVLQHAEINGHIHDLDEGGDSSLYKRKYEWSLKEMELLKKQLKQQQDDDLDQLLLLKKQLEKRVFDANEEADEQRQVAGQLKKKSQRLQAEMNDIKILLEEQTSRNNLLEKKQRKFDQDMSSVHDDLKNERGTKEKVQRERDQILSEKYSFEQEVTALKLELELKEEKISVLKKELDDLSFTGKVEEETAVLKKAKHDLELRVKDQEEELDDLAGQVQMLEAAKIRLEMSLEQIRKENRKEAQQRDEELEEVRFAAQKKVKSIEMQLEAEHSDRTQLVREKHELERRLAEAREQHITAIDEDYVHRLRKELKKTKALLKDTQTMLEKTQSEGSSKMLLRQLKTQLEDAEFAKTTALKARQSAETDMLELQGQLDEALRSKKDAEDRYSRALKEKCDMQTQLEESEEEVSEVMKKYKSTVSQLSVDQITISEQTQLISELEHDKQMLNERLTELSSKVEVLEGETANIHTQKRLQMKIKELESKLDLELTTRQRLENQISRLKDQVDRLGTDCDSARFKESQAVDHTKKITRQLREAKEDLSTVQQKFTEAANRKQELEKQLELSDSEILTLKSDLKLAFKRIEDLQQALQGEISDSDSEISDSESDNDSLSSYLTASSLKYQRSISSNSTLRSPPPEPAPESKDEMIMPKASSERSMSVISEDLEEETGAYGYRESFA